jgi:hypothetical protein
MLSRISHTNTSEMLCAIIKNTLHGSLFLLNFSNFLLALFIGTTRLCICYKVLDKSLVYANTFQVVHYFS